MSTIDALKEAQRKGVSEAALRQLCSVCHIKYGAILPPIGGTFNVTLLSTGL